MPFEVCLFTQKFRKLLKARVLRLWLVESPECLDTPLMREFLWVAVWLLVKPGKFPSRIVPVYPVPKKNIHRLFQGSKGIIQWDPKRFFSIFSTSKSPKNTFDFHMCGLGGHLRCNRNIAKKSINHSPLSLAFWDASCITSLPKNQTTHGLHKN